jgi:GrpB-like predicted nucleotidyltransferase (UPF0157 family)
VTDPRLPDREEVDRRLAEIRRMIEDGRMQLQGESGAGTVRLAPPAEGWATKFAQIRAKLRSALGEAVVRIDHVGSTSIPGIAAKPVIDVQVSVQDIEDEPVYVPHIEALGWPLRSREPASGHRYFRDPAGAPRRVHIHVCQTGSKWERDHLLFRDYLRAHADIAHDYEAVKRAAAEQYSENRLAYTEAKGPFIEAVLERAQAWAAETAWHVSEAA